LRYTILWGMISKVVRAGVQMCYYLAAPSFLVMAILSAARVVRFLCMVMAAPCCAAACMCVGVAAEYYRLRLTALGSASTKRFMFLRMPKRRNCDISVSASNNDLNMR
jgi:hypothetical protein